MAKFTTDTTFYGKPEAREFEAGKEFEMTIKRAEEVVANGKKVHNLDIKLTRLDGPPEKQKDVEQKEDAAETSELQANETPVADEPKEEEPKNEEKKARK